MALRELLRPSKFFLVQYDCDMKKQVRSRGFIRHDDDVEEGQRYAIQWGPSKHQVDIALVLSTGTEAEMRTLLKAKPQKEPTAPTLKRKRQPVKKTASGKPAAKVFRVVTVTNTPTSPPTPHASPPAPTLPTPASPLLAPASPLPAPASPLPAPASPLPTPASPLPAPASPLPTPASPPPAPASPLPAPASPPKQTVLPPLSPTEPFSPQASSPRHQQPTPRAQQSPFIPRPGRATNAFGPVHSRMNAIDDSMKSMDKRQEATRKAVDKLSRRLDDMFKVVMQNQELLLQLAKEKSVPPVSAIACLGVESENIPQEHEIADDALRVMHKSASGPGNFATKCTKHLFPELFGCTNDRFNHSWLGGGSRNKKPLCPVRKEVVRRYTVMFYPEVKDDIIFKARVVPSVNEVLRRREKIPVSSVLATLPPMEQHGFASSLPFGDMMDYMFLE